MRVRHVAWALLAVLALGLVGGGAVAWHEGYRLYAVRTGSMTPTYPTGAAVLDRPAEHELPAVGSVVTFRTKDGLVTHRVFGHVADGFKTKGDANATPDVWTVPLRSVVGEVTGGVPYAGYVLVYFKQPAGIGSLALLSVAITLAWGIFFGSSSQRPPVVRKRAIGPRHARRRRRVARHPVLTAFSSRARRSLA